MERRYYNILFAVIFIVTLISFASAQNTKAILPANKTSNSIEKSEGNSTIKVSVYIINVGKFDISSGAFTVDFYMDMKCDKKCPNQEYEFMNGRASSVDKIIDTADEKFYRIQANLNSPVNLKQFPFDTQKMQIIIEDKRNTIDTVLYDVDLEESGIDEGVIFTGWNVNKWEAKVDEHYYPVYDETYSRYTFTIPLERVKVNSIFKTFMPIAFIILVMLSSFVLDPDKITTRIAMVSSALVASVMFHVSLANQLPPTGYLTFIDKFMVLTYFIILLSFIFNVVLMELHERKKTDLVEKFHRLSEFSMLIIVPILYAILFLILM